MLSSEWRGEVSIPLATFEVPLWASVQRGIKLANLAGGLKVTLIQEGMTRSILLECDQIDEALKLREWLTKHQNKLQEAIDATSRFVKLKSWHCELVAHLIFLRFTFDTDAAAGHNMATKAAEALQNLILANFEHLHYVSISGNYCVDKKNSAINGILGRGRSVLAEAVISKELCQKWLRTTPEAIAALNLKKNLIGSIIAGGVRTANAHFANMLLAFYLALGQDGANVVEGSQGISYAQVDASGDLYFAVNLPNIIIGSVGNGKEHSEIKDRLSEFSFWNPRDMRFNARMLALTAAAAVWAGELSLLAAQTNPQELVRTHILLERKRKH